MYSDICMVIDICIPTQSFSLSSVNAFVYWRMCSLTIECVLLRQNVFVYYRMHSLTIECVRLLQNAFSYDRMCSLTIECILLQQNVFVYYRMHSLTIECVLLLQCVRLLYPTTPYETLNLAGGGAFGNPIHWIADAIGRALYQVFNVFCLYNYASTRYSMSFVFITMPLLYQGLCIRYSMSL